jgi:uncharacterized protein
MIHRAIWPSLLDGIQKFPVVGLIGARQVGKTTLATAVRNHLATDSVYLDLERPSDLAKLRSPEIFLEHHASRLVILDEIQRMPELFPLLRSLVDDDRRPGRFLILGSASPDLMRQSSESLAGRILYLELPPLSVGEIEPDAGDLRRLWLRGGFPGSWLASTDADSLQWRNAFIRTYLERDLPALGIRVAPTQLRRFWEMLAHSHGQLWNASKLGASLGITAPTVRHYLDILQDTFIVRQLQPFHGNLKKRLVKTPKVYLRDSGLLHALLQIETMDDLLGHPALGASWEGMLVEQIVHLAPENSRPWFYRSSGGAEIDLLLRLPGRRPPLAFEIKFATDPAPSRGLHAAMNDLGLKRAHIVCPCADTYPLDARVSTLPAHKLPEHFRALNRSV